MAQAVALAVAVVEAGPERLMSEGDSMWAALDETTRSVIGDLLPPFQGLGASC